MAEQKQNIFSKMLYAIQNFINKSLIKDTDISAPNIEIKPSSEIKSSTEKKEGYYEILPNTTWNLIDVIRQGVSFSVPQSREIRYKQYREMVRTNELLSSVVDIYTDNIVVSDAVDGSILHIDSENEEIVKELEGLFFDRINIEEIIHDIAYEMVLLGDSFWEVVPNNTLTGISHLRKLYCPEKIHRIEKDGRLIAWYIQDETPWSGPNIGNSLQGVYGGYTTDFQSPPIDLNKLGFQMDENPSEKILAPWQIVHFRIPDRTQDYGQYGKSILAPCLYTWQLLRPLEDSLVVYRIVRAPERFRFYIECGNMSAEEALVYLNRVKDLNNKEPFIDPATGQINKKFLALDALSNYYFPMRNGTKSIEMDTLPAGQNLGEINDIEYFNKKLRIASKVPQAYLQEETTDARTRPLTQLDIQFAKTIQRIQRHILRGLVKVAIEHLFLAGYEDEIKNFKLSLTVPSALEKQMRYELFGAKFQLASSIASTNLWSRYTIQTRILGMTEEEAEREAKLIIWQENNLLPSEASTAEMLVDKNILDIKDKIENAYLGKKEEGGLEGGIEMGGLGGGIEGIGGEMVGGEASPPIGGGGEEMGSEVGGEGGGEKVITASIVRQPKEEMTLIKEWKQVQNSLKELSSYNSNRGIIHLFNEGELDMLDSMINQNKKTQVILENLIKKMYE